MHEFRRLGAVVCEITVAQLAGFDKVTINGHLSVEPGKIPAIGTIEIDIPVAQFSRTREFGAAVTVWNADGEFVDRFEEPAPIVNLALELVNNLDALTVWAVQILVCD